MIVGPREGMLIWSEPEPLKGYSNLLMAADSRHDISITTVRGGITPVF
jgi:hypothetical protein